MTKQEFTERTSIKVTDNEMMQIHDIYMMTHDDKDQFCKTWKIIDEDRDVLSLVWAIYDNYALMKSQLDKAHEERDDAEEAQHTTQTAMGEWVARKFYETNDEEMRDKAIELLGKKGYIAYLLEDDFNLFRQDKLLASELLK